MTNKNLSAEAHQELIALYENASMNIETLKNRYWLFVGFYSALSGFVFTQLMDAKLSNQIDSAWICLILFLLQCFALIAMCNGDRIYKNSLSKHRKRLSKIYVCFCDEFRNTRGSEGVLKRDDGEKIFHILMILYVSATGMSNLLMAGYRFYISMFN